VCAFLVDL